MAKRKSGTPDKHKEKPLFLRLPAAHHGVLRALAAENRRTITAEAVLAMEAYFLGKGKWPPPNVTPPVDA